MFLDEAEGVLEVMDAAGFALVQEKLFSQLAKSIASPHLQVARRALYFWSNQRFCNLVKANVVCILPIMFDSMYEGSQCHWNRYYLPL